MNDSSGARSGVLGLGAGSERPGSGERDPGQPPPHSATSDDFLNLSGSQFVLLQDRSSHVCLLSWRFVEATRLSWGYVRLVDYKRLQLDTI